MAVITHAHGPLDPHFSDAGAHFTFGRPELADAGASLWSALKQFNGELPQGIAAKLDHLAATLGNNVLQRRGENQNEYIARAIREVESTELGNNERLVDSLTRRLIEIREAVVDAGSV